MNIRKVIDMTKGRRTKAETKENYWRSPAGIILIQGWAKIAAGGTCAEFDNLK